jgi:hypothetical protein
MALPPIVLAAAEPVRLISPWDEALDEDATGEARYLAYVSGDDLDVSTLTLRPGVEPTWFVVAAFGVEQDRKFSALLPELPAGQEGTCDHAECAHLREAMRKKGRPQDAVDRCYRASGAWLAHASIVRVRLGLLAVEGWPGWTATRGQYIGTPCWPHEAVAAMPAPLVGFLGEAIRRLSTLPDEKKSASGSSPTSGGGTVASSTPKSSAKPPAPSRAAAARASARRRRGARA